ncbi:hypothetical protein FB451DRAFT_1364365 [Mycena latifolia]|nr:hypothetical protein FB451DRAFT_1364365 [Mycena latifolia]
MSSRAASGRKRLRPAPAAPPPVPALPPSATKAFARGPETDSNIYYKSSQPQTPSTSAWPMYAPPSRAAPSPSPSTPSTSSFGFASPRSPGIYQSPPSRDLIPRSQQRPSQPEPGREELTPYPMPAQQAQQVYQPPPLRRDKASFRATNPPSADNNDQTHPPAPSYTSHVVHFADAEGAESRRSSTARALPPYPSKPPVNTGWAALSAEKVASATAVPPSYPDDLAPPLKSRFDSSEPSGVRRTGSVASSSRLPPVETTILLAPLLPAAPPTIIAFASHSPPAAPAQFGSAALLACVRIPDPTVQRRLRARAVPDAAVRRLLASSIPDLTIQLFSSPSPYPTPQSSTFAPAPYPTPQSSSFSSPSTSLASLPPPPPGRRLATYRESNSSLSLSGSSDSVSGGSGSGRAGSMRSVASDPSPVSPSSNSTNTTTTSSPTAAPFVFPSSRSRARPAASGPGGGGGFKFRGRRKLKGVQVLAPGTPIPAEGVFTAQAPPPPPRARSRPPDLRLAPTISTSSGSSGSTGGAPAPPTFYFPSARTRAHPKSPTQFTFNKGKGKKKDVGVNTSAKPPGPGFLRMGFRRAVPPRDASPMARTFTVGPPLEERYGDARYGNGAPEEWNGNGNGTLEEQYANGLPEERYEAGTPTPERVSFEEWDIEPPPTPQVVTKIGAYPLDAYDTALMENDRQTWELLRKLNATGTPSFHNYGGRPPRSVLDLGCGAGHWILDAATAWRNSGVQIVGFDMVDTTKGLWPVAQRKGVADNLKFVRGNFVKQALPFPDGSFQLVRMASLALCIPHEKWEFVLLEARRVLAVGGRLEFIDDHVFFPYGKPPLLTPSGPSPPPQSQSSSGVAPHLDMMIPSTVFSRMSLADVVNPPGARDDADSEIYNLYGVEEMEEEGDGAHSDTDTIGSGRPRGASSTPHTRSSSSSRSSLMSGTQPDAEAWHAQAASARELEALFEHMVNTKFGIHLRPADFIFEMLMGVFGGAREVAAMHLTLAPPEHGESSRPTSLLGRPRGRGEPAPAPDADTLGHCPGLILWPSTFLPMPLPELETHASKHLRVLLSTKAALIDYAAEIADPNEGETQGEAAMEALWEYQNFLRERFNPPPDYPARAMSDTSSSAGDANSIRNSIFSVSSVGSEARDAMREYQNELHTYIEWSSGATRSYTPTPAPALAPAPAPVPVPAPAPQGESAAASSGTLAPPRPRKSRSRGSRGRDRASSAASSVAPPYSRIELTHVRTFYVYEAVKLADGRFGGVI